MKLLPHSLRWRLQLWYGLLLIIVLCAFGVTAYHLEKARQARSVDDALQYRVSILLSALRGNPPPPPPGERRPPPPSNPNPKFSAQDAALFDAESGYYYVIWLRDTQPRARSTNAPTDLILPSRKEPNIRTRGQYRETFLFAAPVDCVLVGRDLGRETKDLRLHATWLAMAGSGVLLLGLIGGGWLISRAIRPIEAISRTSTRIAEGDLSQRIPAEKDPSELGQLAATLNLTFARLEDAFAQQQRFTADAAHELRTPLTVLLTQVQSTLARERSTDEYRESLEVCQRSAQRMRKLLESLLQLARLDAREEPVPKEPFDLARIAAECFEFIRPMAEEQGISLRLDVTPATAAGDADRITQVITNLLINAIQHTPRDGRVTLRVYPDEKHSVIKVSDTGEGIAAKDLPHIFERFYRADEARTSTTGRSGLGLSIVKAIVEAHGSTIDAQSEPGMGAAFTVRLGISNRS